MSASDETYNALRYDAYGIFVDVDRGRHNTGLSPHQPELDEALAHNVKAMAQAPQYCRGKCVAEEKQ